VAHAGLDQRVHLGGFGHVAAHEQGVAAGRLNLAHRFRTAGLVHVRDHHARAFGGENLRGGAADARTRARDHAYLACQNAGHVVVSPVDCCTLG
jgi:hypothetical protein